MAEKKLYPKSLEGLDLTFEESIYAIAFGLENEIRMLGKEVAFKDLNLTAEEMAERVRYCLDEVMYKSEAYALQRVLGELDSTADEEIFGGFRSLDNEFADALRALRSSNGGAVFGCDGKNYRKLLTDSVASGDMKVHASTSVDTKELYEQVQRLMEEVRFYDQKRDAALTKIEQLMIEIQQRKDCPEGFGSKQATVSQNIDPNGSILQIHWPYRSINVLRGLNLDTIDETVKYFQDFRNFVEGNDITLLEWLVIASILRKEGLLPEAINNFGLDDSIDELELTVRAYNGLKRGGIDDFDDLVMRFTDGAYSGWHDIRRLRNFGKASYNEVVEKLKKTVIELDDELCFPMSASAVRALDFNEIELSGLARCKIETIGELLAAYNDQNRFSGLRYIDNELYQSAEEHLRRYGLLEK